MLLLSLLSRLPFICLIPRHRYHPLALLSRLCQGRIITLQTASIAASPFPWPFKDAFNDWLKCINTRRTIHVQPYSDIDGRFVARRLHYLVQEQQQHKEGDGSEHTQDGSGTGLGPLKKRTLNEAGIGAAGSRSASSSSSKTADDNTIDMTGNDESPAIPPHLLYDDGDFCSDDDEETNVEQSATTTTTLSSSSSDVNLAAVAPPPPLPGTVFKIDVMNVGEKSSTTGITASQFAR